MDIQYHWIIISSFMWTSLHNILIYIFAKALFANIYVCHISCQRQFCVILELNKCFNCESFFYMALCQATSFRVSICWVGFASLNNNDALGKTVEWNSWVILIPKVKTIIWSWWLTWPLWTFWWRVRRQRWCARRGLQEQSGPGQTKQIWVWCWWHLFAPEHHQAWVLQLQEALRKQYWCPLTKTSWYILRPKESLCRDPGPYSLWWGPFLLFGSHFKRFGSLPP